MKKYKEWLKNALNEELKEEALQHFLTTNRFGLIKKKYKDEQRLELEKLIAIKKEHFLYIYDRLAESEKEWFRNNFVDKLIELKEFQSLTNFSNLIDSLIEFVKNLKANNMSTKQLFPQKQKLFKDLFKESSLYDKAISILIDNKYIKRGENSLEWVFVPTNKYTANRTIVALCVVLEKEQYFKHNSKAIYINIENEFGIKIDKGNYSRSSNGFKEDYNNVTSNNYSYTSLFTSIL